MFSAINIDEGFAALGLPQPQPAILTALEAIPDDLTAIATLIELPQVQTQVVPVLQMFELATGHNPAGQTLPSIVSSGLNSAAISRRYGIFIGIRRSIQWRHRG